MRERTLKLGDLISWLAAPIAEKVDRSAGWDRLPPRLAILTLLGIRHRLRARNLYDTRPAANGGTASGTVSDERSAARSIDGAGNDPTDPGMGAVRTPFGRNAPPQEDGRALYTPSALDVSERLLTRRDFFPAETLNLLAAAWLQFEVHDWFAHRTGEYDEAELEWARALTGIDPTRPVPANPRPLERDPRLNRRYPPFISDQTHWWDASQLYGAREDFARDMRTMSGGRVKEDLELLETMEGYLERSHGTTAAVPNLWIGSALIHVIFAKEHNAICAMLADKHPQRKDDDEWLYAKARLINAAVMAKIHTVEWTPAVVGHPATAVGARATWCGVLRPPYRAGFTQFGDEVLTGLPGSRRNHDGASYALTEEFVAVYRMHQLIPDGVTFRRARDHGEIGSWDIADLTVAPHGGESRPRKRLEDDIRSWGDAIYSLAVSVPGEITLHNHPEFLQALKPIDAAPCLNLGEIDILRTRETGVPRYNSFRRLFRLEPAASFHDIANGNPKWAMEIRDVYRGHLESVDLLIGMYAERKPRGFAFSDTAFRVFLLMATRRLRSDRFFTTDYTPEVYTPEGLEWIDEATFAGVLRRHYGDELGDVLPVDNAFAPWPRT